MSGVVIGSMLFDILYWNMGFLRVGTAGPCAQAFGRRDKDGMMEPFVQGAITALVTAVLILAVQWLFIKGAFYFLNCSPQVQETASRYFFIRIWAVPAALQLFVFRGWFVGMQNTMFQMVVDVSINVIHIIASYLLAFHTPLGFNGIAWGTVIAQWSGLALSLSLMFIRYPDLLPHISVKSSLMRSKMKKFFKLNGDNFIRSALMLVVYCGFTILATEFGDVQLALSSVMMKLLLLYSYFVDGFAFAGEALTGRYIGERNGFRLRRIVLSVFRWGAVIGLAFTFLYVIGGKWMVSVFTSDTAVIEASTQFIFWLYLMPLVSCVAFIWDGIYVGATESSALRDSMLIASALFLGSFYLLRPWFGIQALYIAYFIHLVARSLYMTLMSRRRIPLLKPE